MPLDLRAQPSPHEYFTEVQARTADLLNAWFSKEWIENTALKISNTLWLSSWSKIEELKALGFTNPIRLITLFPGILVLSIDKNIKPKIEKLKALGFTDPVALITSSPAILGLSIDKNIKPKIEKLKALGFTDPIRLIASSPKILDLSIDKNIKPKIKLIDRFIKNRDTARQLIYSAPEILGTKIDKTWTILRWLQMLWLLNDEIIPKYKAINISELESFILAVLKLEGNEETSVQELIKEIRKIKKVWSKQSRQDDVITWPESKIKERYKRWYIKTD
jgi:hypothetical protein